MERILIRKVSLYKWERKFGEFKIEGEGSRKNGMGDVKVIYK